ncbi:MAG: PKD domain-containing protein [Candidatus Lokiarchaeota archaeon]|nr:PKD domain-containing protein [Candidatus Lokiarchaeota archaeon]
MLKKENRKKILLLAISIFLFSIQLTSVLVAKLEIENKRNITQECLEPKVSGFWELTHSIVVNNNWTDTASEEWVSGSGTFEDPYLIENITINAGGIGSCISIYNTREYFIIRNCTLTGSEKGSGYDLHAGIKLENVTNAMIIQNNCSYNQGCGISIYPYCANNTIIENVANNNAEHGIFLVGTGNNSIEKNMIKNNIYCGIYLILSWNNTILENMIINNFQYGTALSYSVNNVISKNAFNNNTIDGIHLFFGSDNNSLWLNTFVNNSNNAFDGGNNSWCRSFMGNYWDDYISSFYQNGTGMEPYNISESPLVQDLYPQNNSKPSVEIFSPSGLVVTGQLVQFACNISGGNFPLKCAWSLGDGIKSSEINPTHSYAAAGTYDVILSIIDATGDVVIKTSSITVEEESSPYASFQIDVEKIVRNQTVRFTYNGTGGNGPLSYFWDFGDGNNSTGVIVEHVFQESGEYLVFLNVTDANGDNDHFATSVVVTEESSLINDIPPFPIEAIFFVVLVLVILGGLAGSVLLVYKLKKRSQIASNSIGVSSQERIDINSFRQLEARLSGLEDSTNTVVQHKKKKLEEIDGQGDVISHPLTVGEKKALEQTEKEVSIKKNHFTCVVHRGQIVGSVYICPHCQTIYCEKCASTLKRNRERCWTCNKSLE